MLSDVDAYIAKAPEAMRGKLRKMREIIRSVAPEAEERISYGMPFYDYKGRLAYFAAARHHIGLYIPPPIIEQFRDRLRSYKTSKSAVQFPADTELPINLIVKLVRARKTYNEKADMSHRKYASGKTS